MQRLLSIFTCVFGVVVFGGCNIITKGGTGSPTAPSPASTSNQNPTPADAALAQNTLGLEIKPGTRNTRLLPPGTKQWVSVTLFGNLNIGLPQALDYNGANWRIYDLSCPQASRYHADIAYRGPVSTTFPDVPVCDAVRFYMKLDPYPGGNPEDKMIPFTLLEAWERTKALFIKPEGKYKLDGRHSSGATIVSGPLP